MHNYKELQVWLKGRSLVSRIYLLTESFPEQEKFGLTSQMKRAAISIPSNMAEGAGRGSNADFGRFLSIANGSCFELETQLYIAQDLNFINEIQFKETEILMKELQKMLFSLKNKITTK